MARTRAQALPRRSPRIKRNREQRAIERQTPRTEAAPQRAGLRRSGRVLIPPPPAARVSLLPPRQAPLATEMARRTATAREFFRTLVDRHQIGPGAEEHQDQTDSTQRSNTYGHITFLTSPGAPQMARNISDRQNFLFANPRSRVARVYRHFPMSPIPEVTTRNESTNTTAESTQSPTQPTNTDQPLAAPQFDPDELQRLFWRDIFSLDIWNLDSRSIGLTTDQIERIPTKTFKSTRSSRHESCHICLLDFENSQKLKRLPKCGHEFHPECLKPWLEKHTTCPVCRERAIKE